MRTPPPLSTRLARVAASAGVCAVLVLSGRAALAQPPEADALFEQGKQYLRAGDWARACQSFERSFDADASASTSVKIARCREHDGRTAAALVEYRRALSLVARIQQADRARALRALIERAVAELEPRVPKLTLRVSPAPEGLEVRVDGSAVTPPLGEPLPLDPGEHELALSAPGHQAATERVTLAPGEKRELVLALTELPKAPPPAPAEPAPAPPRAVAPSARARPSFAAEPPPRTDREERGSGRRTWTFVLGGASLVSFGVAGYFGLETLDLVDEARGDCNFDTGACGSEGAASLEQATTAQTTGFVLAGVGAALATASLVLFVTEPDEPSAAGAGRVRLGLGPGGATLGASF